MAKPDPIASRAWLASLLPVFPNFFPKNSRRVFSSIQRLSNNVIGDFFVEKYNQKEYISGVRQDRFHQLKGVFDMSPHDVHASAAKPLREPSTTRPLKIVAVITHNDRGGAQEALTRLCHALVDRGHKVSLWYLYKEGAFFDPGLPCRFVLEKEAPTAFDYGLIVVKLGRMLFRERPTALISFLPLANVLAQTLGWMQQIPVRIASQRNPVQTYSRPMQLLDWYFGTCGSYTRIVVNSSDVQSSVERYPWPYRCRTQIIHNGIDPIEWDHANRRVARSRFNMKEDEVALVSVGRLARQKNQVLLIQVLGALKNFRLFLAGSGPELPKLRIEADRMGVADRVIFLGTLDQSETRVLLSAADIFALPSLFEGQSNALLEAMSAGRPIVTSDIPSHRETLTSGAGEAGFLVPITDPDKWIATLRELGSSAARRYDFGQRAKERARDFTLGNMCRAFETAITASLSLKG